MTARWPVATLGLLMTACVSGSSTPPESTPTTISLPASSTTSEPATQQSTTSTTALTTRSPELLEIEVFPVPSGSHPHDVAPAADGGVWYTAQATGELGWLDPETGMTRHIDLGPNSGPHGVIVDSDGSPWVTAQRGNAIVKVDPETLEVTRYPVPDVDAAPHTAVFDRDGILWFTGSRGYVGRLDPSTGAIDTFRSPGGGGPYGITSTGDGSVFYAALAGSYVGSVSADGSVDVIEPPTPSQGARRVWADSTGSIWVSEWNSGNLSRYDPATDSWSTWRLPGESPQAYAVYVDDMDVVWVSDFGSNAMVRFDPATEEFHVYELPHNPGNVRQILGRPGEVWGAESAADHLILIRTVS